MTRWIPLWALVLATVACKQPQVSNQAGATSVLDDAIQNCTIPTEPAGSRVVRENEEVVFPVSARLPGLSERTLEGATRIRVRCFSSQRSLQNFLASTTLAGGDSFALSLGDEVGRVTMTMPGGGLVHYLDFSDGSSQMIVVHPDGRTVAGSRVMD